MLAAWLVYPAVALAIALGIGLLVERAAGTRMPGAMLVPVGLLGLVAASQLTTNWDWSAELTIPLVLALAIAGWALGWQRVRRPALDWWALAAVAGAAAVFAAPQILSGQATFAGYTVLGDTSIHMIGADALLRLGRDFASLPPSSYEFSLVQYYGVSGYPSGGPTAAGTLTSIVHLDVAWTFQCFLTLLAAGLALSLWTLIAPVVEDRRVRAVVTFLAAQPAIVVAYVLQGSVKEIGTAFAVTAVAALVAPYAAWREGGARRAIPLAVASAGALGIVGLTAALWLGPLLLGALIAARLTRSGWRALLGEVGVFAAVAIAGTLQTLLELSKYTKSAGGIVTSQGEFGNLLGPLSKLQAFGIWIAGDYRLHPVGRDWVLTRIFLVVAAVAIVFGLVWLIRLRARSWPVLLYVGVSVLACVFVVYRGSPWADGKALMIVSPAVVLTAMLGAAGLYALRRFAGIAVAAALALGVLWSNALAYHNVSVAPRDRMAELARIGERIDGQGPTLYPEFEEFAKHFLRGGAPEGTGEGWQRRYFLAVHRDGSGPLFGQPTDLDQFSDRYLETYRTIVLRRGFSGSRPPSNFKRTFAGRYYDVWQRPASSQRQLIQHLSVGLGRQPAAAPSCADVRALGQKAQAAGGVLRYAERPRNVVYVPAEHAFPTTWYKDPADSSLLRLVGQGRVEGALYVPADGRYELWIEGSDTPPLSRSPSTGARSRSRSWR